MTPTQNSSELLVEHWVVVFDPERLGDLRSEFSLRFPAATIHVEQQGFWIVSGVDYSDVVHWPWFSREVCKVLATRAITSIRDAAEVLIPLSFDRTKCPVHFVGSIQERRGVLIEERVHERVRTNPVATKQVEFALTIDDVLFVWEKMKPLNIFEQESAPSRAYAKLEQGLQRLEEAIGPDQTVWDIGASPGGFTWYAVGCGARVHAFDRQPLREDLMQNPLVTFSQGDAFQLLSTTKEQPDWIVWDVACTPQRWIQAMTTLVQKSGSTGFVSVVKLKGDCLADLILLLQAQGSLGGRFVHLPANRHELTWIRKPHPRRG